VERNFFGVPFVLGLDDELIKKIRCASVGAENLHLPSPDNPAIGGCIKPAVILMQGELIQDAIADLARLGGLVGTHGMNTQTAAEAEHEGSVSEVIDQRLSLVFGRGVKNGHKSFRDLQK